jgi:hypothetical protein
VSVEARQVITVIWSASALCLAVVDATAVKACADGQRTTARCATVPAGDPDPHLAAGTRRRAGRGRAAMGVEIVAVGDEASGGPVPSR